MIWIARVVAVVLFVIVMTLWATGVKWFVGALSERESDIGTGVVIGFVLCYALWRWDSHIQRKNAGNETRGD